METQSRDLKTCHGLSESGHHRGDMWSCSYQADDDDAASIHTIIPHVLEGADEEDEDQRVLSHRSVFMINRTM